MIDVHIVERGLLVVVVGGDTSLTVVLGWREDRLPDDGKTMVLVGDLATLLRLEY